MPTALMWGRFDPGYSRNRMVRKLFEKLGWRVEAFRPFSSRTGRAEALFRGPGRPDLVWVPCFRQRDIPSAASRAGKWGVPLVIDPLISAFEKEVFEKKKHAPGSPGARRLLEWEKGLFSAADLTVADTPAHADFFCENFELDPDRTAVFHVGAEQDMFRPMPPPPPGPPFEILFYGSFIHLQGADVIVEAARKSRDMGLEARWVLLGDGDLKEETEKKAAGLDHVRFEPWIDYHALPGRIAKAHILLGIFGTTPKAGFVIPNKVFQAMASGRPVITRRSDAYTGAIQESDLIGWTEAGDPGSLAARVKKWLSDPDGLKSRGEATARLFRDFFSEKRLEKTLSNIVDRAMERVRE
ncbi:D-inositol 3-phosphate glycosyltransferase [Candidatus Desulfarcum epimagneticum]|uniref:D-inositol 3-phosphate glycosyltransferase n=1 Tax=uncultured Desulfobacteraceae bacterium TaxID=218296 RepID=A0A484HEU5_9BACT|nr:D-inositol 3-phosphate glycosyltransferase [uncultured Desulfobacteraceae bacterium]